MRSGIYRGYLLVLLMAIYAFNFVDRLALGIVLPNIKADLDLTDTELGVLSGIAFALFYSIMGVPIARWADRGNRVTIISLTCALWSAAVALCGLAGSFMQLLLIRIGVAVGEAGSFAPGLSLISDNFGRAERPQAMAIYSLAWPLSCVTGYFLAGWLNQTYGWRVTFMLLALPGLVLAGAARFTLKEPRHAQSPLGVSFSARCETSTSLPNLKKVFTTLWANASFRNLLLCLSVGFFFSWGILQWQPTFFMRSFHLTSKQVGAGFAAMYALGGIVGIYLGGRFASRYAAKNEQAQLTAIAIAMAGSAVLSFLAYLSPNAYWAFGLLGGAIVASAAGNGPLLATMQALVPESMRAASVALVMLFANLVGLGLGPLAAGALSDAVRPWAAEESLRYALLILAPGNCLAGWLVWRSSRTVTRDLAKVPLEWDSASASQVR